MYGLADRLIAESFGVSDVLLDLAVGNELGDRGVDGGQQALRVALLHGNAVGEGFAEAHVRHDEVAVGLGILLRNGAVNNNGVHLVVHKLVDKVVHARETHEIRAGHIAGDEIGLGRAGLRADALAGEGLNAGVLAGLVGLDEDHRRQVGVVGIGEIGGLETLLGDLDGGEDDVGVTLLQAGHETVKVHVHDLELLAHIRGDRLGNGDVDTDVLLLVLVVQNDELIRGIVGGGRHDESFAFGRSAAAGSETQHHEQSQNDCCYLFHFFSFLSIQRE